MSRAGSAISPPIGSGVTLDSIWKKLCKAKARKTRVDIRKGPLYLMYSMNGMDLRKARLAMGLTQKGLADLMEMTSTSIARMERGEQVILCVTELAIRYLQSVHAKKHRRKK